MTPDRLADIYATERAPLLRYVRRLSHVRAGYCDAEDVVDEAFVRLMGADPDDARALLHTTAWRLVIGRWRHTQVDERCPRPPLRDVDSAETTALARLAAVDLLGQLAGLSQRQRAVLALTVDGCSEGDIAGLLDMAVGTVRTHRARARANLRRAA